MEEIFQHCPICQSTSRRLILTKDRDGRRDGTISIFQCNNCQTVHLGSYTSGFDAPLYDYYENYTGGLQLIVNAEKKMLIVKYYYYTMITEDSRIEKSFKDLSEMTNPWRSGERELTKLTKEDFLNEMKEIYGFGVEISYDGSGDSGWIQDQVDSEKGSKGLTPQLEDIAYEALEMFHAGWEINEGSSGSMIFNFENQTFTIEHYQNIEEEVEDFYKSFSFE